MRSQRCFIHLFQRLDETGGARKNILFWDSNSERDPSCIEVIRHPEVREKGVRGIEDGRRDVSLRRIEKVIH